MPATPLPPTPQTAVSTKRERHPSHFFPQLDLASMTQLLPESLMNGFLPMPPPLTQDSMGEERL